MDRKRLWLTEDVSGIPAQFNDQYVEPRTEGQITFLLRHMEASGVSRFMSTVFISPPVREYQHKGRPHRIPFFLIAALAWLGTNARPRPYPVIGGWVVRLLHMAIRCYLPWRDVRAYAPGIRARLLRLCFLPPSWK